MSEPSGIRLRTTGLDDAQSFLGYVLFTKLSFRILFLLFSITCTLRHRRDYVESNGVSIITRVANA